MTLVVKLKFWTFFISTFKIRKDSHFAAIRCIDMHQDTVGVCIHLLSMDSWDSVVNVLMWQETHSSWSSLNIEDSKAAST
jgi:hypothetical protein